MTVYGKVKPTRTTELGAFGKAGTGGVNFNGLVFGVLMGSLKVNSPGAADVDGSRTILVSLHFSSSRVIFAWFP